MNIYIITEGKTEAIVYRQWIPLINHNLSPVNYFYEVNENNFYIVSAMGFPDYFDRINDAIEDINSSDKIDRLVITVDSEDMSKQEKYNEIKDFLSSKPCSVEIKIVIQHFCFETWALGNRKIIKPNPTSDRLREYKRLHNVRLYDPELLPAKPDEELNRSQFAEKYLRIAFNEHFKTLSYTKSNPKPLLHHNYFLQVKNRYFDTSHIESFSDFLNAFV